MKLDRIDFVQNNKCSHCNRELTTKIAYIAIDQEKELYFGPDCVKKYFPCIGNNIPNFTRANMIYIYESDFINAVHNKSNTIKNVNTDETRIIEYIRLRCEKLNEFEKIEYEPIMEKYLKCKIQYYSNLNYGSETPK